MYESEILKKFGYLEKQRPKGPKGKLIITFQQFVKWVINTDPDIMNT